MPVSCGGMICTPFDPVSDLEIRYSGVSNSSVNPLLTVYLVCSSVKSRLSHHRCNETGGNGSLTSIVFGRIMRSSNHYAAGGTDSSDCERYHRRAY